MDAQMRRKRQLQRRRQRRNQLIRRMLLFVFAFIISVISIISIATGKKADSVGPMAEMEQGTIDVVKAAYRTESEEICIVLDAGHGGNDPGTLWKSVYEKDINLVIAGKLQEMLVQEGYQVIMTRTEDEKLSLKERVRIAAEANADLFVSIHQNALEHDTTTKGIEIYCNENSNSKSSDLADAIHKYLLEETGAEDKGVMKNSDFYVVENATMPACLVETGFITTAAERELLLDGGYQEKIARGIKKGIEKFLGE